MTHPSSCPPDRHPSLHLDPTTTGGMDWWICSSISLLEWQRECLYSRCSPSYSFNQTWQPDISGRALGLYGLTLGIEHVFIVGVYLRTMSCLWLTVFSEHVGSVCEMISFGNVCVIINNFHMTPHCADDISAHFLLCSGHGAGKYAWVIPLDHVTVCFLPVNGFKVTISRV